jgi:predicted nucleic acid-binding protein
MELPGCRYLLDTNVVSEIRKPNGNPKVNEFVDKILSSDLFISVISIGEIAFGIEKLPEGKKKAALSFWFDKQLPEEYETRIIPIDTEAALEWARMRVRAGKTLSPNDALIAATALTHHLTLLTRNTRDFVTVEGLSLISPWD